MNFPTIALILSLSPIAHVLAGEISEGPHLRAKSAPLVHPRVKELSTSHAAEESAVTSPNQPQLTIPSRGEESIAHPHKPGLIPWAASIYALGCIHPSGEAGRQLRERARKVAHKQVALELGSPGSDYSSELFMLTTQSLYEFLSPEHQILLLREALDFAGTWPQHDKDTRDYTYGLRLNLAVSLCERAKDLSPKKSVVLLNQAYILALKLPNFEAKNFLLSEIQYGLAAGLTHLEDVMSVDAKIIRLTDALRLLFASQHPDAAISIPMVKKWLAIYYLQKAMHFQDWERLKLFKAAAQLLTSAPSSEGQATLAKVKKAIVALEARNPAESSPASKQATSLKIP